MLWFTKSRRAKDVEDYETWVEGGVMPTLNAFDSGDVRTTIIIFHPHYHDGARVQGDTMNTLTSYNGANVERPAANQGNVRLAQDLSTTLPFGTQFRTTSGPHGCTWTIGPIGTEVRPGSGHAIVDVPAQIKIVDLEFKSKRTVLTEVSEKYVLQENITVTLPPNTPVHCELVEAYTSKDPTKPWTIVIQ